MLQAQRGTDARMVDDQRRDAADGELARDAAQVNPFLRHVEAVEMDHGWPRPGLRRTIQQRRQCRAFIGKRDEFDGLVAQRDALFEAPRHRRIQRELLRRLVTGHTLGGEKIGAGALILATGRPSMPGVLIPQREALHPLREVSPRRDPCRLRFGIVLRIRPVRERSQRTTRAVDLGHLAAQLRGHHHAEVPRIVRSEILEHCARPWTTVSRARRASPRRRCAHP